MRRLPARSRGATAAGSTAASSSSRRRSLDYIEGDDDVWEDEPLERLARDGQLVCLSSIAVLAGDGHAARQAQLEELWESGEAPWKTWE